MLVLNTISPPVSPSKPNDSPSKSIPFSSTSFALMARPRSSDPGDARSAVECRDVPPRQLEQSEHRTDVGEVADERIPEEGNRRRVAGPQPLQRVRIHSRR